jgi:ADP-heptose:LPS heptosyltransferase
VAAAPSEIETLIISRPDRIGDVIISTSCLAPVKEKYPNARIYFVAAEPLRPLLAGHPLLAGYIPLSPDLTAEFERLQASAIVHLHPNEECYRAACRANVPVRIGYGSGFDDRYLTHVVEDRRSEGRQHEAAYNFDLLRFHEVTQPATLSPNVYLAEANGLSLQNKLPWSLESTRFVVLNPSAHSPRKRWPKERFQQLADRLQHDFDLLPVFISADPADAIFPLPAGQLDLAGKTNLGELAWLLRSATLLISRDTGPAHLAAAVGCPSITLFGRTAPRYGPTRWRPLSEYATVVTKPIPRRWLEGSNAYWRRSFAAISVEEVLAAVEQMLSQPLPS